MSQAEKSKPFVNFRGQLYTVIPVSDLLRSCTVWTAFRTFEEFVKEVDVKNKREWFRLILAIMVSPSIPMSAIATTMWQASGSTSWFQLVFMFGYLFFFLFGLPVVGVLLKKRTVLSWVIGGGCVTVTPMLLLSLFSIASSNNIFDGRTLLDLLLLFVAGCIGGVIFWVFAFAGDKADKAIE